MSNRNPPVESSASGEPMASGASVEGLFERLVATLRAELHREVELTFRQSFDPIVELIRLQDPRPKMAEFHEWIKALARTVDGLVGQTEKQLPRLEEEVLLLRQAEQTLRQEVETLRHERDEVLAKFADLKARHSRMLQEAIVEHNKGSYGSSRGSQHDALLQCFETSKAKIESLTQNLLTRLKQEGVVRHRTGAEFKAILTERLLARLRPDSDPRREVEAFLYNDAAVPYRKFLDQPALLRAVTEMVKLIRETSEAEPRGLLLIPARGEPFDPSRHQVPRGYKEGGVIARTVFPGYEIDADNPRVILKADVLTELIAE